METSLLKCKHCHSEKYDVVTMIAVLHCVADPLALLSEIHSKLSSKGVLMLVERAPGDARQKQGLFSVWEQVFTAMSLAVATPSGFAGRDDGKPVTSEYIGLMDADDKYFAISKLAGFSDCKVFLQDILRVFQFQA